MLLLFFFQAEDGIRDLVRSRGLGDVYKRQLKYMRNRWQAYSSLTIGLSANTIIGYVASWNVVLFQRRWDWKIDDIGLALGLVLLVFGPLGTLLGGAAADRLARAGHKDSAMRITIGGIIGMVIFSTLYPLSLIHISEPTRPY